MKVLVACEFSGVVRDAFTTAPDMEIYKVEFEDAELQEMAMVLVHTKERLEHALLTDDISNLYYCEEWMCAKELRTLKTPARCMSCGKEMSTNQTAKHLRENKGCKGIHQATYDVEIRPSCRWFDLCKPLNWMKRMET